MKILQVCQRPQRRGAEVFANQLSGELRRRGHDVAVVYLYPHGGSGEIPLAPADRRLDGDEDNPLETLIGFNPALLRDLESVVRAYGPDITQVNGARTVKYAVLCRKLKGAPTGPVVYRNIGAPDDWIEGVRRKLFYQMILRNVDGVVPISGDSLEMLRAQFPEQIPLKIISNAVDPNGLRPATVRTEIRSSSDTPQSVPVAVFVGSLTPEKRVDRLLDSVARVRAGGRNLFLWIVGEGPLRNEMETRAESLGIGEFVRFFGARDDVGSYLAAADMLVLVSDTEGVPAVVLEAGYLGLPVVATGVGGVPEVVADGETGLIVEGDDPERLDAAIAALSDDRALRTRLGSEGRQRIVARHTLERITDEFLDFYATVLATSERDLPKSGSRHPSPPPESGHFETRRATVPDFRPEMRLLTVVARRELEPVDRTRVREILIDGLDFELLFALAHRHRLFPLMASHLREFRDELPGEVRRSLQAFEFVNGCRILERTGQLLEILSELRARNVVAVPYKGPALAAQLYGSGALRPAGDLDVAVLPRNVPEVRRVMVQLGYRPQLPLRDDERVGFMLRHRYDERFVRDAGCPVELHWGFTNRDFPFALDLNQVFGRRKEIVVGGHAVPAFCDEDLLLILSVHGAKHRWDRLEWLAGVAELLRSGGRGIDWAAVLRRSSDLGVRRSLFLALRLASNLLQAPCPAEVLQRVDADAEVDRLATEVVDLLCRDPVGWEVPDRLQRDRFRIRLRERWRDRWRFVWHRATTPSDPERWHVVRMGPWNLPLHAVLRPFHVAGELTQAARALIASSS